MKRDPALVGLSHDHHHALSRARRLRRGASADSIGALAEARAFLAFFEGETTRHFEQEERFVFPILGSAHALVRRALTEHATIRALVTGLAAEAGVGAVSPEHLVELASALELHVRFEERELFAAIQQYADPTVLASVARRLDTWADSSEPLQRS
jgi:hypothetical protein